MDKKRTDLRLMWVATVLAAATFIVYVTQI
jgi:hypothetical protein